jgi:cytochrome b561
MTRYTRTAIGLHWLMALLIVAAFVLGVIMTDIPGFTPAKLKYFSWHKWLGVTVLWLAAIRLLWRLKNPPPAYPATMPQWQYKAAHGLHGLLYLLFFAVPISGYCYSLSAGVLIVYFGVLPLPVFMEANAELKPILKSLHWVLVMSLALLVAAHLAAAIKHQLLDRDDILKRMLP